MELAAIVQVVPIGLGALTLPSAAMDTQMLKLYLWTERLQLTIALVQAILES
jgi:hypothetical protein